MNRRLLASCTVALGLTLVSAFPSFASTLKTPSHKEQQLFLHAMNGILPEATATNRHGVVELGIQVCAGLNEGYSVQRFLKVVKVGEKGGPPKDTILVLMGFASAVFCPQFHPKVEKYIDAQPG
jgi:hypothetical protein